MQVHGFHKIMRTTIKLCIMFLCTGTCDTYILHEELSGTLSSPLYPVAYRNNMACTYVIAIPAEGNVAITLEEMSLPDDCSDKLEVRYSICLIDLEMCIQTQVAMHAS